MNNPSSISKKEPFIRIEKRTELYGFKQAMVILIAILVALVAGGIFILCLGHNPFVAYKTIVYGAFSNAIYIKSTIELIIPLVILSLGITLAFKMKFWNIGAEGQFIMGALFATFPALFLNNMPHILLLLLMFLFGFIGGGLFGLLPAYFKSKYNTNETLFTLMLNYVALYLVVYLKEGPWRDPSSGGFPKIASYIEKARLDTIFNVHIGWIVGLLLVVIIFFYIKKSKHGYEISVVGESENTANYAGMNVKKIVLRTMFISGGICGIAGMLQASGVNYCLDEGIASGVGFTAIIIAWLARLNPLGILFVSIMFGILEKGCGVMESSYGFSSSVPDILQGIILFCILACDFFTRYKFTKRHSTKEVRKEEN